MYNKFQNKYQAYPIPYFKFVSQFFNQTVPTKGTIEDLSEPSKRSTILTQHRELSLFMNFENLMRLGLLDVDGISKCDVVYLHLLCQGLGKSALMHDQDVENIKYLLSIRPEGSFRSLNNVLPLIKTLEPNELNVIVSCLKDPSNKWHQLLTFVMKNIENLKTLDKCDSYPVLIKMITIDEPKLQKATIDDVFKKLKFCELSIKQKKRGEHILCISSFTKLLITINENPCKFNMITTTISDLGSIGNLSESLLALFFCDNKGHPIMGERYIEIFKSLIKVMHCDRSNYDNCSRQVLWPEDLNKIHQWINNDQLEILGTMITNEKHTFHSLVIFLLKTYFFSKYKKNILSADRYSFLGFLITNAATNSEEDIKWLKKIIAIHLDLMKNKKNVADKNLGFMYLVLFDRLVAEIPDEGLSICKKRGEALLKLREKDQVLFEANINLFIQAYFRLNKDDAPRYIERIINDINTDDFRRLDDTRKTSRLRQIFDTNINDRLPAIGERATEYRVGVNVHSNSRDQKTLNSYQLLVEHLGENEDWGSHCGLFLKELEQKCTSEKASITDAEDCGMALMLLKEEFDNQFSGLLNESGDGKEFIWDGVKINGRDVIGRFYTFCKNCQDSDNAMISFINSILRFKDEHGYRICQVGQLQHLCVEVLQGRLRGARIDNIDFEVLHEPLPGAKVEDTELCNANTAMNTFFSIERNRFIENVNDMRNAATRFIKENPAIDIEGFKQELTKYWESSGDGVSLSFN